MPFYDWKLLNMFDRTGLEAWHQYDAGVSGNEVIYDVSGNSRHLAATIATSPVLVANQLNEQPAWYFDGTKTPLTYTGALNVKHVFIVAAVGGATFADFNGLLSDTATKPLLIGAGAGTSKFFDLNGAAITNYTYRKSDTLFPPTNQLAPMLGKYAILEMTFPDGIALDGIQIGRDRADNTRKFNGHFAENIMFSQIKTGCDRTNIYRYLAVRYHLWRKKADDFNVFPFPFHRATPFGKTDLAEISEAEGGRGRDKVVRYFSDAALGSYDFRFDVRRITETKAADKFLAEHRLHLPFWVEDIERETERKITRTSPTVGYENNGAGSHNYGFTGSDY